MIKITTTFSILLLSIFVNAQEKHQIDIELEKCLSIDSNQTTVGMSNCVYDAEIKWDKELNKYYKLLMDTLNRESRQSLQLSQRQWIEYRDKEFEFIYSFYLSEMQGTMWENVASNQRMEFVKHRALELKQYYENLALK